MITLIKSELLYNRLIIYLAVLLSVIFFSVIWLAVQDWNVVPNQMLILLVMTFLAAYVGESRRVEKKRDRFQIQLPLPLLKIGLFRILYPAIMWLVIIGVFFITSGGVIVVDSALPGLKGIDIIYPQFNQFLILNGWVFMTNSAYLMLIDGRSSSLSNKKRVLFRLAEAILPFMAMAPFYLVMNFMGIFGDNQLRQTIIAITMDVRAGMVFNLLAIILIVINLIQFLKKSSYL